MFSRMSGEVRNLLLVASELGGEVAQYVKVLRKEKERLLPVDVVQADKEELIAERDQAQTTKSNILATLIKANNRAAVAEKDAASYKKQLERQAEELELIQTNRVHAEVYQKVAAERDRALAELRDQLKEQWKIVAELRAQLIERATPEFMHHHMTLTRQVADLQSACHSLRQRNMTLAGDISVVHDSLNQANSELGEAKENLKRMEEDKKAAAMLLRQVLDQVDRLQYSAGMKTDQ